MKKKIKLNNEIGELSKVRPYFIEELPWVCVKAIILEIRKLAIEEFLTPSQIKSHCQYVEKTLNTISDMTDAEHLYTIHCYICDLIDWYITVSTNEEEYEMSANLTNLQSLMCVKIIK